MFDLDCLASNPQCRVNYCGSQDALHFLSNQSAAGDEMGYDFITHASSMPTTLSGYCGVINQRYTIINKKAHKFMSRTTFTDWLFSWMASFQKDFRKKCSLCGQHPKYLGCDGTKVGVYLRQTDINPIEMPTIDTEIERLADRNSRGFFNSKEPKQNLKARDNLQFFCTKYTGGKDIEAPGKNEKKSKKKKSKQQLPQKKPVPDEESLDVKRRNICNSTPKACLDVIRRFVYGSFDQTVLRAFARICEVFASEKPLTSLVNYKFVDQLQKYCEDETSDVPHSLKVNLPEISDLFIVALKVDCLQAFKQFFLGLCKQIIATHKDDQDPQKPEERGSYNPELGRAYYFTAHGRPVRDMPKYLIDSKKEKKSKNTCQKKYPWVAKSGVTYLFLWFCPAHYGHCYGFHVIPEHEGRKDVHASAYLYLPQAPEDVFYDFSCQAEEYCLNREPKYWRNTRWWHDIFHGFTHKCPFVYNSRRITALKEINSEICEQFNSYLQKIKYSCKAMSQSHFIFFLQFFIDKWSEDKERKFKKRCSVARKFLRRRRR